MNSLDINRIGNKDANLKVILDLSNNLIRALVSGRYLRSRLRSPIEHNVVSLAILVLLSKILRTNMFLIQSMLVTCTDCTNINNVVHQPLQ